MVTVVRPFPPTEYLPEKFESLPQMQSEVPSRPPDPVALITPAAGLNAQLNGQGSVPKTKFPDIEASLKGAPLWGWNFSSLKPFVLIMNPLPGLAR
jgi:hypothetical protein